jgi:hypothetical protein
MKMHVDNQSDFLWVAGYPEKHWESPSRYYG